MSSKNQLIQVPWPRRLNTDRPATSLATDETPVLRNIMPRLLPHEVRPRNPIRWKTLSTQWGHAGGGLPFRTASTNIIPYNAVVEADGQGVFIQIAQMDPTLGGALFTNSRSKAEVDSLTTDPWTTISRKGGIGIGLPNPFDSSPIDPNLSTWDDFATYNTQAWGTPVYYDNCVFWCAAANVYPNSLNSKYVDTSTGTDRKVITKDSYIYVGGLPNNYNNYNPATSVTTTATVSNGSTKVTIPAAALGTSFGESGLIMTLNGAPGVNGMPNPAYQYQYRVKTLDTSTTLTLERPYGLGESAANCPNLAACSVTFRSYAPLQNCIPGATTLALFNDRIVSARGTVSQTLATGAPQEYPSPLGEYGGYYGNAIFWSKPGNWNRWPDQNFALVDQDGRDPITALYTLGDKLLIFKSNKIFVMTGYDEDSFQIDKLTDVVGCPYPQGMVQFEGTLYFANMDGVWSYDGQALRCISSPAGGQGISRLWTRRPWHRTNYSPDPDATISDGFWPTLAVTPDAHLLVVVNPGMTSSAARTSGLLEWADHFVYDIRNDCWAEWGMEDKSLNPVRVITQHTTGRVFGVHRWWLTELTDLFNPSVEQNAAKDPKRCDAYPPLGSLTTPTPTEAAFTCNIEAWFQPGPGNTVRVRECQVEHGALYLASTWPANTPSDKPVWTFKIATNPNLQLGTTQHTIYARIENASTYSITDVTNNNRMFSDRFPETFQTEAQAIRVSFTGTVSTTSDVTATPRYSGWSMYALKFTVDTTRQMGVDNTAYTNSF